MCLCGVLPSTVNIVGCNLTPLIIITPFSHDDNDEFKEEHKDKDKTKEG